MYSEDLGIELTYDFVDDVVEEALMGILTGEWTTKDSALRNARFETFAQNGIMTDDKGIVVKLPNGRKFQLTIVQSR